MVRLFRFIALLPLWLSRSVGALMGQVVYAASPAYRAKMRANLAIAGYPASMCGAAARETGRMMCEIPFIWFRSHAHLIGCVRCDDGAVLDEAEREGRGILFLTPHLGAFEVTARYYASRHPITVMFKPPKQAALGAVMAAARALPVLKPVPAALSGVRAMLRALRAGEAVGLLPDQVPGDGEGRWVPFFGRRAYTMTLPLRLVQSSGAAVVLTVAERLPGGDGWRVHFERMRETPTPEAVNGAMERLIRRWPEQYLWGYNRYKVPASEAAAKATEGSHP